ncbi:MAG: hypothetical protein JWM21_1179 [Acidobacteria bacterium]|nr:hypothetical protein [Acidobacteriota bacterium]
MANAGTTQKGRTRQNRFFVLLLVLAALSGVVKDLERLQTVTRSIHGLTASWLEMGSTVYASGIPSSVTCPTAGQAEKVEPFRWTGLVAAGQSIEIKGINGGIIAEPAAGNQVEVVATKKARRSDPVAVNIRVVPHAKGVTICAVYPNDPSDQPNTCEPGDARDHSHVRNNDVSVNFVVRVPSGVQFIGRTINGEIRATSLTGNVDSRTVNGSINISTSGYAQANTVNGEITARMGSANWSDSLEFKTVNGGIDLDLPGVLSTQIEAETFNGSIDSDFPLTLSGRVSRKHVSGTIGGGGRELLLKTLNGSIHLKRVG